MTHSFHRTVLVLLLAAAARSGSGQAPDGGPWAPALFDASSVVVEPRECRPGDDVRVRFTFRVGHAKRVVRLELHVQPGSISMDVTPHLDRSAGVCSFVIPGKLLSRPDTYELRMAMEFDWDDGKRYRRSPPFGQIVVHAFAGFQYTPESLAKEIDALEAGAREARQAAADAGGGDVARLLLPDIRRDIDRARALVDAGDHPAARSLLMEARQLTVRVHRDPARAAHEARVARFVEGLPSEAPGPSMSLMPGASAETFSDDDIQIIRELGIGTVIAQRPADVGHLQNHGLESMVGRAPVRFTEDWVQRRPQDRQHRYLLSDPVAAEGETLSIDPLLGFLDSHYDLDPCGDTRRYWRVLDVADNAALSADRWRYDPERRRVDIRDAIPGRAYRVAALVQAKEIPFFKKFGEPMHPPCMEHILRRLDAMFTDQRGLEVYRPTSLFYPFPKIEKVRAGDDGGSRVLSWHNFYGYQWGVSPSLQERFTRETGVAFDPLWMVDGGRYGDVNYPPQDGYLRWMEFQQTNVIALTKRVVDVAHGHGARVRVFWGDHWIGMEPYAGNGRFFSETGMDEIVKACGSAVVVRMVADIPSDVRKIIRFSPWFSHEELFSRDNPSSFMDHQWGDIKRGALFRMPDGFTWGGDTQSSGFNQPIILDRMKAIANEFRLMHSLIGGEEAFHHDLTVYVLNAWGALRSWTGWLQVNESQQILTHLTDLPVTVRFLSLADIAARGVPDDADVLINAGEPHSAWSGGFHWTPDAVAAVERFVAAGGGLIGIGAPSHFPDGDRFWRLAPVLGVDFADSVREGEGDSGAFSRYDSAFLEKGPTPMQTRPMMRTKTEHFITEQLPASSEPVLCKVRAAVMAADGEVLCSRDGSPSAPPMIFARRHQAGRAVYINGYGAAHDYGRMLRRAIFWSAGREGEYPRLVADHEGVLTYAYPEKRLLAVHNQTAAAVTTTVRLDPSILGFDKDHRARVTDVLSGLVETLPAEALKKGISRTLPARGLVFLRIASD